MSILPLPRWNRGEMWACCRRRGEWLLDATGSPPHLSCTQTTHTDGAAKVSHRFFLTRSWIFWFSAENLTTTNVKVNPPSPTQLMWVVGDWRTMIPTFESWWIWKCSKSSQQCDFSAVLTRAQDNWQVLHSPFKTLISSSVWHFNSINATRGNSCSKQTTVIKNKQTTQKKFQERLDNECRPWVKIISLEFQFGWYMIRIWKVRSFPQKILSDKEKCISKIMFSIGCNEVVKIF